MEDMQKRIYKEDEGTNFGLWNDDVSRLMYHNIMPLVVGQFDFQGTVADYGGANGLLKDWIPQAVTIDIDESKKPDIVDDITTHSEEYDNVYMRYVLHYMNDEQIGRMLANIKHKLIVVQFTNEQEDLTIKNLISNGNEDDKHFRDKKELFGLFADFAIYKAIEVSYEVTPAFYANRLQVETDLSHKESIQIIGMERK